VTSVLELIAARSSGLHPTDDLPTARAAGRENHWHIIEFDTSTGSDKVYFLEVCREAFQLPDYFGANWDALADSLTDVDDNPGTLVLWRGANNLEASVRETAAEVFAERAARIDRGLGAFLVLVDGEQVPSGATLHA
jgi:RNAse (barnase) inhibitor barstar